MSAWTFQDPKQLKKVGEELASWCVGWYDPDGNRLVSKDPAGTTVWKLNTGAGFVFGFHTLAASLYPTP